MTNFTNVVLNDCVCELLEKLLAMCSGNFFLQSKIEAQICVVTFLVLARNKGSIFIVFVSIGVPSALQSSS